MRGKPEGRTRLLAGLQVRAGPAELLESVGVAAPVGGVYRRWLPVVVQASAFVSYEFILELIKGIAVIRAVITA